MIPPDDVALSAFENKLLSAISILVLSYQASIELRELKYSKLTPLSFAISRKGSVVSLTNLEIFPFEACNFI